MYLLDKLVALSYICYPAAKVEAIKEDESDNRLLEAAVESESKYIISGDKHLKKLLKFKNITICSPAQFLNYLDNNSNRNL